MRKCPYCYSSKLKELSNGEKLKCSECNEDLLISEVVIPDNDADYVYVLIYNDDGQHYRDVYKDRDLAFNFIYEDYYNSWPKDMPFKWGYTDFRIIEKSL